MIALLLNSGRGTRMGDEACVASQPAYKFLNKDFCRCMEEIRRLVEVDARKCYAENTFNAAWEEIELHPLDVKGRLCAGIDNIEDHTRVTAQFRETVRNQA